MGGIHKLRLYSIILLILLSLYCFNFASLSFTKANYILLIQVIVLFVVDYLSRKYSIRRHYNKFDYFNIFRKLSAIAISTLGLLLLSKQAILAVNLIVITYISMYLSMQNGYLVYLYRKDIGKNE
ncbi:MAG: hypothetical protein DI617_00890 [Streptococcus pyogenes]|nr:MAG: hypothetical protein DI617_00890 [Streptococcus pyogenes]